MHIYTKRLGLSIATLGLLMFMGVSCSQQPSARNINVNIVSNDVLENSVTEESAEDNTNSQETTGVAKEFIMTSFYEMVDGQPKPQFSMNEIKVKKGDKVRIKITNTKGGHDFVIDEYNINQVTPLDQQVVIEFIADKAGEYVYYCSVPNHRALGQWGTLKVE